MTRVLKTQQKQFKKIERVEARLNPEQKRRIEYAASLKELRSLTSWFPVPTMLLYGPSSSMKCGL